jgi:type II secretory pathway component PulM
MFAIWFILLFISFAISVIMLTQIQTRLWKQFGWRVFRERPMLQMYWRDLTHKERALLWPGVIMFLLTLLSGTLVKLFRP